MDYLLFGEEGGEKFGLEIIPTKYHIAPLKVRWLWFIQGGHDVTHENLIKIQMNQMSNFFLPGHSWLILVLTQAMRNKPILQLQSVDQINVKNHMESYVWNLCLKT